VLVCVSVRAEACVYVCVRGFVWMCMSVFDTKMPIFI